jgi:hypothetical protein
LTSIDGRETAAWGLIDPRPTASSPALTTYDAVPSDDFFETADYVGAFAAGEPLWLEHWSWLAEENRTPETTLDVNPTVSAGVPEAFRLLGNYPNPFNPTTSIRFELATHQYIRLAVYDLLGSEIKSLHSGNLMPGMHEVVWDGKDSYGREMPSGIYLYRVQLDANSMIGKMTLLK